VGPAERAHNASRRSGSGPSQLWTASAAGGQGISSDCRVDDHGRDRTARAPALSTPDLHAGVAPFYLRSQTETDKALSVIATEAVERALPAQVTGEQRHGDIDQTPPRAIHEILSEQTLATPKCSPAPYAGQATPPPTPARSAHQRR